MATCILEAKYKMVAVRSAVLKDALKIHCSIQLYTFYNYSGTLQFQASELWPPLYNSHMLFVPNVHKPATPISRLSQGWLERGVPRESSMEFSGFAASGK